VVVVVVVLISVVLIVVVAVEVIAALTVLTVVTIVCGVRQLVMSVSFDKHISLAMALRVVTASVFMTKRPSVASPCEAPSVVGPCCALKPTSPLVTGVHSPLLYVISVLFRGVSTLFVKPVSSVRHGIPSFVGVRTTRIKQVSSVLPCPLVTGVRSPLLCIIPVVCRSVSTLFVQPALVLRDGIPLVAGVKPTRIKR
jgi:hypothetical protein